MDASKNLVQCDIVDGQALERGSADNDQRHFRVVYSFEEIVLTIGVASTESIIRIFEMTAGNIHLLGVLFS